MIILFALQCVLSAAFLAFSIGLARDAWLYSSINVDWPEVGGAVFLATTSAVLAASAVVTWQAM